MKAIEFKSKIRNHRIKIPNRIKLELKEEEKVRVIVLIEDPEKQDEMIFQDSAKKEFLNGYADSDSIYDED